MTSQIDPKPTVIIIMGVSGSGKTTIGSLLANQLNWSFQDADSFHSKANIEKMSHGIALTGADRAPWLDAMRKAILKWISEGTKTVLACSALKSDYRNALQPDPSKVRIVYLKASIELLDQRLRERHGHFMKSNLLKSQLATLEEPKNAVIADAAGTPEQIVAAIRKNLAL